MGAQAGSITPKTVREYIVFPSAARTATPTAGDFYNPSGNGLYVRINATAAAATPSVVFTIQGYDPAAGAWYTILDSAAVTGISTVILRVHPALTASANLIAKDLVPLRWRVNAVHADADSITYSVGAFTSGMV